MTGCELIILDGNCSVLLKVDHDGYAIPAIVESIAATTKRYTADTLAKDIMVKFLNGDSYDGNIDTAFPNGYKAVALKGKFEDIKQLIEKEIELNYPNDGYLTSLGSYQLLVKVYLKGIKIEWRNQ